MTPSTFSRVDSRTFTPPLRTRETVPTPTPAAAATSAIVGRSGVRTGTSHNGIAHLETIPMVNWLILTPLQVRVKGAGPARRGQLSGSERSLPESRTIIAPGQPDDHCARTRTITAPEARTITAPGQDDHRAGGQPMAARARTITALSRAHRSRPWPGAGRR